MRYFLNSQQTKAADRYTIQEKGVPAAELMERAAAGCIMVMEEENLDISRPCVVCGSGNNGGDGLAIARLLAERGYPVRTCFVGTEAHCTEENRYQMRLLKECGVEISNEYISDEYSIIIDAIFGVGLSREVIGRYYQIIQKMNEEKAVKFAVDIPSGISTDQGCVMGIAFKADYTVTFQTEKLGLALCPGREYAGKVIVADVGIDTSQLNMGQDSVYSLAKEDYRKLLPCRPENSNKGDFGKLLIIAGSKGMAGAAYLNAMSAYMAGAGLVQIYTPEDNRTVLQNLLPEAIITTYDLYDQGELIRLLKWADTVCIGSGIGTSDRSRKILRTTLEYVQVPCLIDADGLNLIAEHHKYMNVTIYENLVITPHMKEMSRLLGTTVSDLKARRMELLEEFVKNYPVTCILKDARTLVASPEQPMYVNLSGNSSMAKAGSGDVLSGMVAGLMAQGMKCRDASVLGTYLHGRAGDHARDKKGSYSVMARDLIEHIADAFKELEEENNEKLHESLCKDQSGCNSV